MAGLTGTAVSAAPLGVTPANPAVGETLVDQVQYRRDCIWVNGGWYYGRPGKYLVCKPYRPYGRGWIWHKEGHRHGWYHPHRKHWHYNKW
jgi:hypothetical protein